MSVLETATFCTGCGTPLSSASITDSSTSYARPGSAWAEVAQRLNRATLGEFEIGRELGRGAMAAVFLAHEISLDRKVAIKVMSPALLMDEGMADRFRQEAITIAHLNHPNIVSVHSVRQAEGLHFFVMRYIHGRSLEQVIQQAGPLPIPIVRSILNQVGSALTYAHRCRVVHRDIKPANILIDEDGNAVVTDFGIAKVSQLPSKTNPGVLMGTPAYMSPEQCSGDEVSGASDQYSLGAVAYEMITGESPFTGSTLTVMQAHLEQPPSRILERRSDCPADLEAAVLRMLEKDPAARWPSIAHAKAALGTAPLAEDDPLLAELGRLARPDWNSSLPPQSARGTSPARARGSRSTAPSGAVRSISILPPPATLESGDSFALVATLRGEHGVPLPLQAIAWTTDTPEVLRIDQGAGVATAVAPGSARLSASCEGVRAHLQVHVAAPVGDPDAEADAVGAVQISAPPKSVKAGDSFVLTATPVDDRGGVLLGRTVQWSTSDVGVAVVTASGWVVTLGSGQAVLTASCEGVSASVSINVDPAVSASKRSNSPPIQPLSVAQVTEDPHPSSRRRSSRSRRTRLIAAATAVVLLVPLLWLSSSLRHSAVTTLPHQTMPAPNALEPAPAIVRGAAASVVITGVSDRFLRPGQSARLQAEVRNLAGEKVPGSVIRWFSSDSGVIQVDSAAGQVRALHPGRAWVIASMAEWQDSAAIVVRRPVAQPAKAASVAGDTTPLAATVPEDNGNGFATLDTQTGQIQGYAPDTSTISATSGSDTATSQVSVLAPEPATDTLQVQSYQSDSAPVEEVQTSVADSAGPLPGNRAVERLRLISTIIAGVQQCYDALRSKDITRVTQLYHPATRSDVEKLNKLNRILQTKEWAATVGERIDRAPELGTESAAMEFSFRLSWKDAFGGHLASQPVFRAELTRKGDEWEISSCRIVGSPKL
jgi:eukaryotic-like serine/threonine-protein kinase